MNRVTSELDGGRGNLMVSVVSEAMDTDSSFTS
jgi:hypothetical protein